ncbi:MAG: hypothetical protein IJP38_07150 [Oscillospiraceae bacterium]|nr:hypothetical protein [Oscillospiraceae bacterium]
MANLTEMQQKNLANLDLEYGSGIFKDNTRVNSVNQPTVIISLGGLGGKTLNSLKRQIMRRVKPEGNAIRLLAIDSADNDLAQYDALVQNEETVSIYETSIGQLAKNPAAIPQFIKEWKHEKFTPNLNGTGCGGVRQNGRFSLAAQASYNKIRSKIHAVINSARAVAAGNVNVIFVAGISGGTGSGTIIDMAYLTQDILLNDVGLNRANFKVSAYIFMPNVQFAVNGVSKAALSRNGYAALKEIDYYYNIEKSGGTYKWPFAEGAVKDSKSKIFDFCTIVSGANDDGMVIDPQQAAINVTVESLMSVITDAQLTVNGQPQQLLTSFLDNGENTVNVWLTGSGADASLYPRSTNYCYNVIGYGSAKVPVDAIMSYMANEMYKQLLDEFFDTKDLTANFISNIMNAAGVGDVDSIIRAVKDASGYTYATRELPKGGDIKGLKGTYTQWKSRAYEHYKSFKQQQQFNTAIDAVTQNIIKALDSKLELVFDEHGPYFVVRTITATTSGHGVDGVLEKLHALRVTMSKMVEERTLSGISAQQIEAKVDAGATDIGGLFGVSNDERDSFMAKARQKMEMYTIELDVMEAMIEKLKLVSENIIEKNNKVFDVYTAVLDYIKDVLSKNSELVVNSARTQNAAGGVTYSLDVVNLDAMNANGKKLKQCVDSFLTERFINTFKGDFVAMLRDRNNRPAFTDQIDDFDASTIIQNIFSTLLGNYYQEALERFLIAFYSTDSQMKDSEYLDAVMGNQMQKDAELTVAATAICQELKNSGKPLCNLTSDIATFAPPQRYMVVPASLKHIFSAVAPAQIGHANITICERPHAFSIDIITNHIGIPLAKVKGLNDWDLAYDAAIASETLGLHMDENNDDLTVLPAPLVSEEWERLGNYSCAVEKRNMERVKALVSRLDALGMILHDDDAAKSNARILHYFDAEITEAMLAKVADKAKYEINEGTDKGEFVKSVFAELGLETKELPIAMLQDPGLPGTYDNRYIIMRKNVTLFRKVSAFMAEYEKIDAIVETAMKGSGEERVFQENITTFANLIKAGMIKYEKGVGAWKYNDGMADKMLFSFAMEKPFVQIYNTFFAFSAYITKLDQRLKDAIFNLAREKFANGDAVATMPDAMKADIDALFAPGLPQTAAYLLDRELNFKTINDNAAQNKAAFDIPLPGEDYVEKLTKFYLKLRENFMF